GRPLPRIEDDLERYARRCLEIDRGVGQVAAAFEHAGAVPQGGASAANTSQPVVAAEATIAATLEEAQRAAAAQTGTPAAPPPPKKEEHALLKGLIHAVEHPGETLSGAASALEHAASDALGTVELAAEHRLHDLEAAGAALVHGFEHPGETLDAAASGLEKAAGEVVDFGGHVVSGAEAAGGEVLHALEHPQETLAAGESLAAGAAGDLAAGAEHVVGDVVGGAETAGDAVLHGVEHAVEHPGETAAALATGAENVAGAALHGLESLGGGILDAIEHPMDTLSNAEQAVEDFVTGFAAGVKDMAQAAMLLARVIPGSPMWMASLAIDPEGTVKLQEQFARGLAHMVENPGEALGTMIDIKDLQNGDYAKWLGHLTPDVIVAVLTAGGGGAAAAAGEGMATAAAETTAEQVAKTVAEDAAKTAAEDAAKTLSTGLAGEHGGEVGRLIGEIGGTRTVGARVADPAEAPPPQFGHFDNRVPVRLEGIDPHGHANSAFEMHFEDGSRAVFKPQSGEQAFLRSGVPPGSQWQREIAAWEVDERLGYHLVPRTRALQEGTHGMGSTGLGRGGRPEPPHRAVSGSRPATYGSSRLCDWEHGSPCR
ncbi:MAG: hypothetical protein QOE72_4681, partial [Chloroflexota bacterium]|nr:hypothetical protein [Chloroflexota bacterium]